jgi:iron complex transport system substrate-binding protein
MHPRRLAAAMLTLAFAATACGGGASDGGSASTAETAETAETAGGPEAAPGPRTVSHDQGETQVPATPERVVVLDSPHLDAALSLGVTPVAAVSVFADEGLPAYLGDRTEDIEVVGTIEEPDLEAIAALEPDLILSATVRHEGIYDELSQIAPTVFTASSGTDWKQGFGLVAEALDEQEEGQQALDEYEARVAELGGALDADAATAAIVRFLPGETRVYGPDTFSGSVLTEVGFDLPELEYDEYSMAYISAEQVDVLQDADTIFTTTYGDPAETTEDEVTSLWENLPAVANGCQFAVEDGEWMIGIGLIGAGIILDDLASSLTDAGCS